jgi:hypothetical protein
MESPLEQEALSLEEFVALLQCADPGELADGASTHSRALPKREARISFFRAASWTVRAAPVFTAPPFSRFPPPYPALPCPSPPSRAQA